MHVPVEQEPRLNGRDECAEGLERAVRYVPHVENHPVRVTQALLSRVAGRSAIGGIDARTGVGAVRADARGRMGDDDVDARSPVRKACPS